MLVVVVVVVLLLLLEKNAKASKSEGRQPDKQQSGFRRWFFGC